MDRRVPAAALAVPVALLAGLLAGCTSPGSDDVAPRGSAGPSSATSSAAEPEVAARLEAMNAVPVVRREGEVARRLELLGSVLRDPDADPAAVRRAAELEQVAARTLARAPQGSAREVLRLLPPGLRRTIANDVAAARALSGLAAPQPRLPDWRLVAPPPAARLLSAYRAAERRTGVGWEHLAAIHLVETRMGRIRGVSTAGAQGPMQFLPATWEIYGAGGDIHDVEDAVMAAARLLRANGAPADMGSALLAYNNSEDYVLGVEAYAANMRRAPLTYRGYRHWRVLYNHVSGTKVLPVGYPRRPAVPLAQS